MGVSLILDFRFHVWVTPMSVDARRQVNTAGTIVTTLLVMFWLWAAATGHGRWFDALLPGALLAMFVRGLVSGHHPRLAGWLQRCGIALVAASALYAGTEVWELVHHVSG